MYVKIQDIRKRYEGNNVIDKISFISGYGDKVGLIGKNGQGKTTLLKLIAGLEEPTSGHITKDPKSMRIGYLRQVIMNTSQTIASFIISSITQLADLKAKLDNEFDPDTFQKYQDMGGFEIESQIKRVLGILNLSKFNEDTVIKELSGGERTRLQLAPILISTPDALLLDEPTNHLDIDGINFLEEYIRKYKGIVIVATHDRSLLLNCMNRIIEIDKGKILDVSGDYDIFLREKELNRMHRENEYKEKVNEVKKLNRNISMYKRNEEATRSKTKYAPTDNDKMGSDFLAEKAARKFGRRIEILNRKLEEYDSMEKPVNDWKIKIDLDNSAKEKVAFFLEHIYKGYKKVKVLNDFTFTFYSNRKYILSGKNGSGKSTLLKILNKEIKPDKGEIKINETIKIGYLSQDHLEINISKTIIQDFLDDMIVPDGEAEARTYLHKFLFKDFEVYRKIETFSQGEKAKYAFAKLLFKKPNFLLLDEPTNYMDIESKEIIEKALKEYTGGLIIATHDRSLMSAINPDETIKLT